MSNAATGFLSGFLKRGYVPPWVVSVLLVILVWQGCVEVLEVDARYLPSLGMVARDIAENWHPLLRGVLVTGIETLLGFLLGVVFGMGVGVVLFNYRFLDKAFFPLFVISQTIPVVAFGALIIIWFGNSIASKVIIAFYLSFLPVVVNTKVGLDSADPMQLNLLRSFGTSGYSRFIRLQLPVAMPLICVAMKIGVSLSLVGAMVGEWFGAMEGLGALLIQAMYTEDVVRMWTLIFCCGALGSVFYGMVEIFERKIIWWGQAN